MYGKMRTVARHRDRSMRWTISLKGTYLACDHNARNFVRRQPWQRQNTRTARKKTRRHRLGFLNQACYGKCCLLRVHMQMYGLESLLLYKHTTYMYFYIHMRRASEKLWAPCTQSGSLILQMGEQVPVGRR